MRQPLATGRRSCEERHRQKEDGVFALVGATSTAALRSLRPVLDEAESLLFP